MAEKIVDNLEWEITDIREDGSQAEIDMEITNLDMADVAGNYEILLLENMIAAEGTGMWQMVSDIADLANGGEALLALMDEQEDTCTMAVTVLAYQENGCWKLHADDEFINAFMGNMNLGEYSEEVKGRLAELEEAYAEKMEPCQISCATAACQTSISIPPAKGTPAFLASQSSRVSRGL